MTDRLAKFERAFAEVGDAARQLVNADWDTWESAIETFDHAVTEYDVRGLLAGELPANDVDIEAWLNRRAEVSGAIPGKAPLQLPPERELRTAFLLDLVGYLRSIDHSGRYQAMLHLVGLGGNWDARVRLMSDRLFRPLAADLLNRLATHIEREMPPPAPPVTIVGDGNVYASEGVYGSIIANKGAVVTHSSATYTPTSDAGRAVATWLDGVDDIPPAQRGEVQAAIMMLARAADQGNAKMSEAVAAVEAVTEPSPTLRARLRDLAWGVATDSTAQAAVASAPLLWRALKAVFGTGSGHP